jgi:hypothetical protein
LASPSVALTSILMESHFISLAHAPLRRPQNSLRHANAARLPRANAHFIPVNVDPVEDLVLS